MAVQILLAEDEQTDAFFVQKSFENAEIANQLYVVKNGQEALDFLGHEGDFSDAPTPDIILMDIKMPGKDGHEALSEIRKNEDWDDIPVIMLSSSSAPVDVMKSYKNGANAHVTKCTGLKEMMEFTKVFEKFWFSYNCLAHAK